MPGIPKNPLVARAFSHNLTHDTTRDLRIFRDIDGFSHKVSHQLKANLHQSTQLWLLQALPGLGGRESLVAAVWAWSGKHPACVWLLCSIPLDKHPSCRAEQQLLFSAVRYSVVWKYYRLFRC